MSVKKEVRPRKRFLLRHVGNMGDLVILAPPVLANLKQLYPDAHITFVTAWGYKDNGRCRAGRNSNQGWGRRSMGGHGIHLMMTNPHIDQLVHWHDTKLSLTNNICREDGQTFPTWNSAYWEQEKKSGKYDRVIELDIGLTAEDNPLPALFTAAGLPPDSPMAYRLYFSERDREVAAAVMAAAPRPRLFFLETVAGLTTRSWDPDKVKQLEVAVEKYYGVPPLWFGAAHTPLYRGRPLTLRENIALLEHGDVGIGVLSGPLHFAVAAGLPTLTLYCDHTIERAAPAYFCGTQHRTLLGPSPDTLQLHKYLDNVPHLTPRELFVQNFISWQKPGRQATKSCLAAITVDEVMRVLADMLPSAHTRIAELISG
ncbi:MAG: hypothetical protein COT71_00045 [Candidatus Andersenbacteria bacterium CG10_big_fil_rev_8_21_14_0_10_54_11]|uniref:Glycosyltransferase family 9 protein n=1 Tax=Candidatus Andersenbacteria bacterium CG10_big_fil_rev_8_21_14_0_10_54_11 TaxID=1974485 RepID=A0A2M6X0N1_9BACT|nr:MAG: hypothetical protein COT71_00045 [Candidatus Andersenbacteria bacterium CG10_big_fil_rev_8_21_14_0_10_54_11]